MSSHSSVGSAGDYAAAPPPPLGPQLERCHYRDAAQSLDGLNPGIADSARLTSKHIVGSDPNRANSNLLCLQGMKGTSDENSPRNADHGVAVGDNTTALETGLADLNKSHAPETKEAISPQVQDWELSAVQETTLRECKSIGRNNKVGWTLGGALSSAAVLGGIGVGIGSLGGPVGMIAGAVVGGVVGLVYGGYKGYRFGSRRADRLVDAKLSNAFAVPESITNKITSDIVREQRQKTSGRELEDRSSMVPEKRGRPTLSETSSRLSDSIAWSMAHEAANAGVEANKPPLPNTVAVKWANASEPVRQQQMQKTEEPQVCRSTGRFDRGQPELPDKVSHLATYKANAIESEALLPGIEFYERHAWFKELESAMAWHLYGRCLALGKRYSSSDAAQELEIFGKAYLQCMVDGRELQTSPGEKQAQLQAEGGQLATARHDCVSNDGSAPEIAATQSRLLRNMHQQLPPNASHHVSLDAKHMQQAMGKQKLDYDHPIHGLRTRLADLRRLLYVSWDELKPRARDVPLLQAIDLQLRMCAAAGAEDRVHGDEVPRKPDQVDKQILNAMVELEAYLDFAANSRFAR